MIVNPVPLAQAWVTVTVEPANAGSEEGVHVPAAIVVLAVVGSGQPEGTASETADSGGKSSPFERNEKVS